MTEPGTYIGTTGDGSTKWTYPDGRVTYKQPDGTIKENYPDGTWKWTFPDGSQKWTYDDGAQKHTYPDGTESVTTPWGEHTTTYPDGTKNVTWPDGTSKDTYPNGITKETYPDGVSKYTHPDGNEQVDYPDGTRTWAFPDGQETVVFPDGNTRVTLPDGTIQQTTPVETGGGFIQMFPTIKDPVTGEVRAATPEESTPSSYYYTDPKTGEEWRLDRTGEWSRIQDQVGDTGEATSSADPGGPPKFARDVPPVDQQPPPVDQQQPADAPPLGEGDLPPVDLPPTDVPPVDQQVPPVGTEGQPSPLGTERLVGERLDPNAPADPGLPDDPFKATTDGTTNSGSPVIPVDGNNPSDANPDPDPFDPYIYQGTPDQVEQIGPTPVRLDPNAPADPGLPVGADEVDQSFEVGEGTNSVPPGYEDEVAAAEAEGRVISIDTPVNQTPADLDPYDDFVSDFEKAARDVADHFGGLFLTAPGTASDVPGGTEQQPVGEDTPPPTDTGTPPPVDETGVEGRPPPVGEEGGPPAGGPDAGTPPAGGPVDQQVPPAAQTPEFEPPVQPPPDAGGTPPPPEVGTPPPDATGAPPVTEPPVGVEGQQSSAASSLVGGTPPGERLDPNAPADPGLPKFAGDVQPDFDPNLLDPNEPGTTLNPDLLDPIAPGPTLDTGLVPRIEENPELVNAVNQNPDIAGALEQDPAQLDQIERDLGFAEGRPIEPSGPSEPAGVADPGLSPDVPESGPPDQDFDDTPN